MGKLHGVVGKLQKIIGVDPGLTGAIATYDNGKLCIYVPPIIKSSGRGREVVWDKLADLLQSAMDSDICYIERVSSRPGEGCSSAFKFGYTAGGVRGMMAQAAIPVVLVTPQRWKKHFGLSSSKTEACACATHMFPKHKDEFYGPRGGLRDGPAEAALIARYGYDMEIGNV